MRYLDAQRGDEWIVPVAVLTAALSTPALTAAVLDVCLPVADRWSQATQVGLEDIGLARAAVTVFMLAGDALPALTGPGPVRELVDRATERVLQGRCPGDEQDT